MMKSRYFQVFYLFLWIYSNNLNSQVSSDFPSVNFIKLGEKGLSENSLELFNGDCKKVSLTIFNCKHKFESYIIRNFNSDSRKRIDYLYEIDISIKVKNNTEFVLGYFYFIPIDQIMYLSEENTENQIFLKYIISKRVFIGDLLALDKVKNFALWKSKEGFGFSYIDNNKLYFEACIEREDCNILLKNRKKIFSNDSLYCGSEFNERCDKDFENVFFNYNLFEIFWFKIFK